MTLQPNTARFARAVLADPAALAVGARAVATRLRPPTERDISAELLSLSRAMLIEALGAIAESERVQPGDGHGA